MKHNKIIIILYHTVHATLDANIKTAHLQTPRLRSCLWPRSVYLQSRISYPMGVHMTLVLAVASSGQRVRCCITILMVLFVSIAMFPHHASRSMTCHNERLYQSSKPQESEPINDVVTIDFTIILSSDAYRLAWLSIRSMHCKIVGTAQPPVHLQVLRSFLRV